MKYNFQELLKNINVTQNMSVEAKSTLEGGTMQLWAIFDKLNGGSGVVNHNGQIVDYSNLKIEEEEKKMPTPPIEPPMPTPPPPPQPTPQPSKPKETKGRKPKQKLTLKDLNIDIKSINLDDL